MRPYIIGIAGPSGAGKSVFCRAVEKRIPNVSRLKMDDFFRDERDVPLRVEVTNWDHPSSWKWDELLQAVYDLKCGRTTIVPTYYRKHNKTIGEKCVMPSPVMLLDGFLTLAHERLRGLMDASVYLSIPEELQIARRVERQPDVAPSYLYDIMLPIYRVHIQPSSAFATHVIDSTQSKEAVADEGIRVIEQLLASQSQHPTYERTI